MISNVTHRPLRCNCMILLAFLYFADGLAQNLHAGECNEPVARAISLQGRVEILVNGEATWTPFRLNDNLCPGDRLRVKAESRAGLLLHDDTLVRLDELTNVIVNHPAEDGAFWFNLIRGISHFISRVKGTFHVRTPYVDASIEGTEFVISVNDIAADIVVFDGVVVASNTLGAIELTANQSGRARRSQPPIRTTIANPRDAVVWTLYYPPLPKQPDPAYDLAQQAVTAIAQNRLDDAIGLAKQATALNDRSAAAYMAQSYVDQARFDIPAALRNSRKAAELAPASALTQARLAEAWLMNGETDAARTAANRAVSLDPQLSLAHAALGFSSLRDINLETARGAFEKAVQLDSSAPLPRFGLGLVKIRQGELESGRQEIETAVLLDPNSALLRSYLGKAYYEEKRNNPAADQFAMAKTLDPNDPTAWFYDSILLQSENRPVEALRAQRQAIGLNDNRAVYRSRQLLDEDQAARSASQALIYTDLGFKRLALKESWKSLVADPGNPSAHRFLSDSYAEVPRHEIARASELLRAQLLTPEIVTPVSPSASEVSLPTLRGSGPSLSGFNEYNPLFNNQRLALLASGITGSKNTRGNEIVVGGFTNRGMLSAGYYEESSDGFRKNDDSDQNTGNLFGQIRISPQLSLQAESKHRQKEYGDLAQLFEQDNIYAQLVRREIDDDSYRLGFNYAQNLKHTFLLSVIKEDKKDTTRIALNKLVTDKDAKQFETQYIYADTNYNFTFGYGRAFLDEATVRTLKFVGNPNPVTFPPVDRIRDQKTAYLYLNNSWPWGRSLVGVDYASLDQQDSYSESRLNPKLGLIFDISESTILRLAGFKTMRTDIINDWTIAPTQIIGFNQIYDDFIGTAAKRYALALDHRFTDSLNAGVEFSRRIVSRLSDDFPALDEEQRELSHKGYLYWSVNSNLGFGANLAYEKYQRDFIDGRHDAYRPATLNTQTLQLTGNYFHQSGLSATLSTSYVAQDLEDILGTTGTAMEKDSFSISDLVLGYRLPKRRGQVDIEIKNLFDKEFRYQGVFPGTGLAVASPYYPERACYLTVKIWL